MCGIAGYIGHSKKPKLTYELITAIFSNLELRGIDASGVWGTEFGEGGRVIYHKEPIRSSEFVKQDFWSKLRKIRTDMLLVHSRATSSHGGDPDCNMNNHPFVSQDKRIGMVHNGTIEEINHLSQKYQRLSRTDSEVLLRIFEHGLDKDYPIDFMPAHLSTRINGIKDIWSYVSTGAMAVALGERVDDYTKNLFVFRNDKRPLWLADLRNTLGQIYFFSSPDIWYIAIENNNNLKKCCWSSSKLIEIPSSEIWSFTLDYENTEIDQKNIHRFKIESKNTGVEFSKGDFKTIKSSQSDLEVVTELDDGENFNKYTNEKITTNNSAINHDGDLWHREDEEMNRDCPDWSDFANKTDHEDTCKKIIKTVQDINTSINNLCLEGSLNSVDYNELLESLEQTKLDLEGTLSMINK